MGDEAVGVGLLGERLILWRDSGDAHAFRDLCITAALRSPSVGSRRRDHLPLPRLALRGERGLCSHSPTRRPDARSGQGQGCRLSGSRALQARLGFARGPRSASGRARAEADVGEPILCGPFEWSCDASRRVETSPTSAISVGAPRASSAIRRGPSSPRTASSRTGTCSTMRSSPEGAEHGRLSSLRERGSRRAGAAQPLRSSTSRTRSSTVSAGAASRECCASSCLSRSRPIAAADCSWSAGTTTTTSRNACFQEFEEVIFGQDRLVVESQRPEQVPFDLAAELHLQFDAVAVAYRRAMRDQGLAAEAAPATVGGGERGPGERLSGMTDIRGASNLWNARLLRLGTAFCSASTAGCQTPPSLNYYSFDGTHRTCSCRAAAAAGRSRDLQLTARPQGGGRLRPRPWPRRQGGLSHVRRRGRAAGRRARPRCRVSTRSLCHQLDSKIVTTELANEAGVPAFRARGDGGDAYSELLSLAVAAGLRTVWWYRPLRATGG